MKLNNYLLFLFSLFLTHESVAAFYDSLNSHGHFARKEILNIEDAPYRFIGNLNANCTGTLVGNSHILTAAHCLFSFQDKRWLPLKGFTLGMNSEQLSPYGEATIKKIFLLDEYKDTGKTEYDYAIVELDQELGAQYGMATLSSETEGSLITIAGYPGDKNFGSLWSVTCPYTQEKQLLSYLGDTAHGMSGSAIFTRAENGIWKIIGIHTDGGQDHNFGARLTPQVLLDLNNWIHADQVDDAVENFYRYCLEGNLDKVRMALHSKKIYINARLGANGMTALAGAASMGQASVVEELLKQPFIQVNKFSPLSLAVQSGSIETVEKLLQRSDIQLNDLTYGETPLYLAVQAQNIDIAILLVSRPRIVIEKVGKNKKTPLQLARELNNQQLITLLDRK